MSNIVFISVDNNYDDYKRYIEVNSYIKDKRNVQLVRYDNSTENITIPCRYNHFLENYDFSQESWFVFCHNDFELLEDIEPKLKELNKEKIYGPFGARNYIKKKQTNVREYCGDVWETAKDGSNKRHLCFFNHHGRKIDTLDCMCIIVHSSLFNNRDLRFDEKCAFDMYAEDFCVQAVSKYNIETALVQLKCIHHSQCDDVNDRPSFMAAHSYMSKKYKDTPYSKFFNFDCNYVLPPAISQKNACSIYQCEIDTDNPNNPKAIIFNRIKENSTVLDVGCSAGMLGKVLFEKKNCKMFGFEYDEKSVEAAQSTNAYENITQIDLNNLEIEDYPEYIEKFDYLVLADVLEHLAEPQKVLLKLIAFMKKSGKIIVSLPNISHASIISSLLFDEWQYIDYGILDRTHLRFFTYKSMSELLAGCALRIEKAGYCFRRGKGFLETNLWTILPFFIKWFIGKNPQSFVYQYIVECSLDIDKSYTEIKEINQNSFSLDIKEVKKKLKLYEV